MEDAARAICELRNSDSPLLHLTHPRSLSWHTIANAANSDLGLQVVSYDVWFSLLQESAETTSAVAAARVLDANPALKLVGFFADAKAKMDTGTQAMGFLEVDGRTAQAACAWLHHLPCPSQDVIVRWLRQYS